jgi:hypothetical protein
VDPGPISIILLSPIYFTRTVYFTRILLLFSTRYAHTLCFKQTGEIDNLIASWKQSTWLCVCRFRVATCRRRVNKCPKRRPCWSAIKPVRITFSRIVCSSLDRLNLDFLLREKTCCCAHHTLRLEFSNCLVTIIINYTPDIKDPYLMLF